MTAYAYACSNSGYNADEQIAGIRAYLGGGGDEVIFTDEGALIALADRPGWQSLLSQIEPACRIVVWGAEVLFTSPFELLDLVDRLEQAGSSLTLVREGVTLAAGKPELELLRGAIRAFRSLQSSFRGQAIKAALDDRRQRGVRYCHHAPVGKYWVGRRGNQRLADDPNALAVAEKVREWRRAGSTWQAISSHLRRHDVRRRGGRLWNVDSLRRLLGVRQ